MKHLPNIITLSRILFSISLLFVDLFTVPFVLIYLLCGFTDAIDGFAARKMKVESMLGARLDTVADIVMFAVILYLFIPRITFSTVLWIWLLVIASMRLVSMGLAFFKYGKFVILHTISNKVAGLLVFLLPLGIGTVAEIPATFIVCAVASISALEELAIQITSKELDVDRKGYLY